MCIKKFSFDYSVLKLHLSDTHEKWQLNNKFILSFHLEFTRDLFFMIKWVFCILLEWKIRSLNRLNTGPDYISFWEQLTKNMKQTKTQTNKQTNKIYFK